MLFVSNKKTNVFLISTEKHMLCLFIESAHLIVLGFNDTSTLVGHFVSSPRERENRDRRDSRGDERGTGKKEENELK